MLLSLLLQALPQATTAKEVVGVLTATGALVASGWKGYHALREHRARVRKERDAQTQQFNAMMTAVTRIEPMVHDIQRELKANGGASLRDAITDIRNHMAIDRAARRLIQDVPSFEVAFRGGEQTVLAASHAFVRLTGLTREDCERDGWIRCVAAHDRDRVAQLVREAYESESVLSTTYHVQHVHTRAEVAVEHIGTPVTNHAGHLVGWIAVLRPREDLT